MFDAFMGWDTTYAIEMVRLLNPLHPTWVEEPVPPERVGALRKIREAAPVPIATGEHIYTRWQAKELLVNGAVDFLQNDPDWTGGISELTKVCALASSFETPVVAHGHSLSARAACGRRTVAGDCAFCRVSGSLPGGQAVFPSAAISSARWFCPTANPSRPRHRTGSKIELSRAI